MTAVQPPDTFVNRFEELRAKCKAFTESIETLPATFRTYEEKHKADMVNKLADALSNQVSLTNEEAMEEDSHAFHTMKAVAKPIEQRTLTECGELFSPLQSSMSELKSLFEQTDGQLKNILSKAKLQLDTYGVRVEDSESNLVQPQFLEQLGSGAFGAVYKALVGSRMEALKAAYGIEGSLLSTEWTMYRTMAFWAPKFHSHYPDAYGYFKGLNGLSCLRLELLGLSLNTLQERYAPDGFSEATICCLIDQAIPQLQALHLCTELVGDPKIEDIRGNYLHRDLKPDNVMVGQGPNSTKLFVIDFGLCKRWDRVRITRGGIGAPGDGTKRYTSMANHRGQRLFPRDDLECLGYTMMGVSKVRPDKSQDNEAYLLEKETWARGGYAQWITVSIC